MNFLKRSSVTRVRLATSLAGMTALALTGTALAQADSDAPGVSINEGVFNLYLESRTRKPAAQATAEERQSVRSELVDIYLLSEQPRAAELGNDARIQAQIELQTRALLAQAVAADFLSKNQASDAEIQSMYDEQIKLAPESEYKARHILVETQNAAAEIIGELEGGADFAELAKSKSTGPSGPSGGDLGWFSPQQMVPEFSTAVGELENGAFTKEPVQTQFGWHVILREDSRDATPPPLESVRDAVKQQVEQQKLQEYLDGLRAAATE